MPTARSAVNRSRDVPTNRGPAAAPANRGAILAAARDLFSERGFLVPLNAVAREAGVGQGVLYRHFPTRLDLAFAVFEENLTALERAAVDPGPDTFARLWSMLLDQTVREAAFVEMMLAARRERPDYDGETRLRRSLGEAMRVAQDAGTLDERLDLEDVVLAWRMAFGLVTTADSPDAARRALRRALGPDGLAAGRGSATSVLTLGVDGAASA